jgi:hypothetical protein
MTVNRTVMATFGPRLTIVKAGTGAGVVTGAAGLINCGNACSAVVKQGSVATLMAAASAGSIFSGWSTNCSPQVGNPCNVTMDGPKTVTATFQPTPPSIPN